MTAVVEPAAGEVGASRRRKEDVRLITGRTRWTDNIVLPGMLHLAILRSPHASARIVSVDVRSALRQPGVIDVFSAAGRRRHPGQPAVRLAGHRGHRPPGPAADRRRVRAPPRRGGRGRRGP